MSQAFLNSRIISYSPEIIKGPSDLNGEVSKHHLEYWNSRIIDGKLPDFRDADLMDMFKIASRLAVIDVPEDKKPDDLLYRYVGTKLVEYRGHRNKPDLTGLTFKDGDHGYDATPMRDAYEICFKEKTPVVMRGEYQMDFYSGMHERLICPWLIDGSVARLTVSLDRFEGLK